MPRYAFGTVASRGYRSPGADCEIDEVSDHADDAAAIADYQKAMREDRPDVRLELVDIGDMPFSDDPDFIIRVADDFPTDSTRVDDEEVVEWVATFMHHLRERDV